MRNNLLYLAILSDLAKEPVLICEDIVAEAKSAINVSSVSPDLCDMTDVYPFCVARSTVSRVSVKVPIWFTLMSIEFATSLSMPCWSRCVFVTKRSSPTS